MAERDRESGISVAGVHPHHVRALERLRDSMLGWVRVGWLVAGYSHVLCEDGTWDRGPMGQWDADQEDDEEPVFRYRVFLERAEAEATLGGPEDEETCVLAVFERRDEFGCRMREVARDDGGSSG